MNNKTILLFLIFSFFIFIIFYSYYLKLKHRKHNIKLLCSITNLDRGNIAEHNLIIKLLKAGISPKAIFHDLYIKKSNGKFCQIDLLLATKVGIIVFDGDSFLADISFIPNGTYIIKPKRVIDVINKITKENKAANYKDKRKIINLLKHAVLNGNDENIVNDHIKNTENMLGKHRIFE